MIWSHFPRNIHHSNIFFYFVYIQESTEDSTAEPVCEKGAGGEQSLDDLMSALKQI